MNKLAKYIIGAAVLAIIVLIVWYFRSIITYILIAALLSLMGRPVVRWLSRLRIRKWHIPKALSALIVMLFMFGVVALVIYFMTPLVSGIASRLDSLKLQEVTAMLSEPMRQINALMHHYFPSVAPSVTIESLIWTEIDKLLHPQIVTRLFGSVASFLVNFGVGLFSVVFITFFFLKEENMFGNMVMAIVPEKYEEKFSHAMKSVNELLLRYFLGIVIQVFTMTLLISTGLHFIVRIEYQLALVLGLLFGIFNIVPYVGPLLAGSLGIVLGIVTSYGSSGYPGLVLFVVAMAGVYVGINMLDTYLFQPVIYSSSIKAHPLEIFIVILVSGYMGGAVGMLVAIPAYTVLRVFASEFLSRFKVVQRLTS
ncbi:MAG: AI-2E family transporter [Bacteroidales bacterium]|jgi:predicted PurR-regulated permease PerM|nr:AI-2E family transporter [Bacteroidales bacterium]MDD3100641.1 AI-2E family transporter [Bacteroidales bacterium]MDD3639306.1 AI-2E family transporter [Bacteroidales bacterium]MDD3943965.1 AI-2E family transporter [Bacteroidales bacterium]MDD4480703.1 AI-2E family transporter [Bacteroidales bacterium]